MGLPQHTPAQDLKDLASRLRSLLEPWAPPREAGGEGLELSAAELEQLAARADLRRLELAGQVKRARLALEEVDRLAAAGGPPAALERARQGAALTLERLLGRLAETRRELDVLRQVAGLYPSLLLQARRHLAASLPEAAPSCGEALGRAWQAHRQARAARRRCERLAGLARRIKGAERRLESQARDLEQEAARLDQCIQEQGERLARLDQDQADEARADGALPGLAELRRELELTAGPAVALNTRWQELALARRRQRERLLRVGRAWREAWEQWEEHAAQRSQAAELVLELAGQRLRSAEALEQVLGEFKTLLWPLRPAELEQELEALAQRARGLEKAAQQEQAQARRLREGGKAPPPPPADQDGPPPAAAPPPLVDLSGLEGLRRRAGDLVEAGLARKAERERRSRAELERARQKAGQWAAQLRQLRRESRRLRELVEQLKARESAARREGQDQLQALKRETQALKAQVEQLSRQMRSLAVLAAVASAAPAPGRGVAARVTPLEPKQVEGVLARLAGARRALARLGKHGALCWALALGLGAGLVLALPGLPAKATLRDHTPRVSFTRLDARVLAPAPAAEITVRMVPLDEAMMPLALLDDPDFTRLSSRAGLSPYALYRSARAAHPGSPAVDLARLEGLAAKAHALAQRHPAVFADLSRRGLPPGFGELLRLPQPSQPELNRFADRLYLDYRRLGYSRSRALATVAANSRAAARLVRAGSLPRRFWGRVRPVRAVEKMKLSQFLDRLGPYIAGRCRHYLQRLGRRPQADLERYARDLAFDMYCAARQFQVPVSYLLTIAHQETFYANVLGDDNLSASPFQIWRPTLPRILRSMRQAGFKPPPRRIRLQNHLSIATYLAAYHLRELMIEAVVPRSRRYPSYVNMDQVMLRYNGSKYYAGRVAVRRAELDRFVARLGS